MKRVFLLSGVFIIAASSAARATRLEARVVDSGGAPVADAVVFVESPLEGPFAAPERPSLMDQVDKEFVPHVLPILVGGSVRFPNKDDIHHSLYSLSRAKTFELPLYKGEPAQPILFDKPGVVQLGCNIHDWMSGVVLVLPNPYFAKTGTDGTAVVEGFPAGRPLRWAVFHERLAEPVAKTVQAAASVGATQTLRWTVTLKAERPKKKHAVTYP